MLHDADPATVAADLQTAADKGIAAYNDRVAG